MPFAVQIDDDAYAIAKVFADQAHCSVASAVSRLVIKSGFQPTKPEDVNPHTAVRFPLVKGTRPINAEQVARLEDES